MFVRACAFAVALLFSGQAAALEPGDLVGVWTTQWANAAGQAPDSGGPVRISADSNQDSLDGLIPGPGWDGVMTGEVKQEDGALVWSGAWVSIWPEGLTRGSFRFVFTSANTFTGVWSTDDGAVREAVWNGQRAD